MIILYITKHCSGCAGIDETLKELCIAHKTVVLGPDDQLPAQFSSAKKPPVLVDGEEVIQGSEKIVQHLQELAEFKALWDKYQSDACYCGEED